MGVHPADLPESLAQIDTALRERALLINEYASADSDVKGLAPQGPGQPRIKSVRVSAGWPAY